MSNKKRLTDFEDLHVAWKSLLSMLTLIIILAFLLIVILFVIVGAQLLFSTVDNNVIAVLVPTVFGILTYWHTKHHERKMSALQNARSKNMEPFNEYVRFLLQQKANELILGDVLSRNSELILICSNDTIKKMNLLVTAIVGENKKTIDDAVENLISAIRTELGFAKLKKGEIIKTAIMAKEESN